MMVPELTDILAIIFFLLLIILWKALKKESKKNKIINIIVNYLEILILPFFQKTIKNCYC